MNAAIEAGRIFQEQGLTSSALYYSPAWEMVRSHAPDNPNEWPERWAKAGGPPIIDNQFIAPKLHPVWGRIGNPSLFEEGLNVPYPPFWRGSAAGWLPVSRGICIKLGLMQEDGQWTEAYAPDGKAPIITPAPVNIPLVISDRLRKLLDLQRRITNSQRRPDAPVTNEGENRN